MEEYDEEICKCCGEEIGEGGSACPLCSAFNSIDYDDEWESVGRYE
jgi:predicted amidophosphoribosyltransferase